jgi:two-component system response regulator MprA
MLDRVLRAEGYAVETAADGGGALAAVERSAPDLVVLDVAMAGLDGIAVCRRLRAKGLTLPVLLLTARDGVPDRVAGLDAGADDYLVKPFATDELLARVRALLRRGKAVEETLAFGDLTLDLATRVVRRGGTLLALSPREAALLELLLRNARRVVTREQAVTEVWSGQASANAVDRYVSNLRRKLGAGVRIETVRGVGFILR